MNLNVIIDGNHLAYTEFSILNGYGKKKDIFKTEDDKAAFLQSLLSRMFYLVNSLPSPKRIVFCLDSKSWRKDIDRTYKESREDKATNSGMDKETKEAFYSILKEAGELMNSVGICCSQVYGAEGDDLMFQWARYFKSIGECSIIISGDKDMMQTVSNSDGTWTVVWSPRASANKMSVPIGWKDSLQIEKQDSIFDFSMTNEAEGMLKSLRDLNMNIESVYPQQYILKKILIGDPGDDVPAVWNKTKADGKIAKVTDKKADKIIEYVFKEFGLTVVDCMRLWNEEEFMDVLAGAILRITDDVDGFNERELVKLNLQLNAKLVWLTEEQIPLNLQEMMKENIKKCIALPVDRSRWNKNMITTGTKYHGKSNNAQRKNDPFAMMDLPDIDL